MRKVVLLFCIIFLMAMSGCKGKDEGSEAMTEPEIAGISQNGVYTTGVAVSVKENPEITYTITLNNEKIENGKLVMDDGDYSLRVVSKRKKDNTEKEKILTFKIVKDENAPAGSINDMINIAQKIDKSKRSTYISSNFERLKNQTEFPVIKGNKVTFVYKGTAANVVVSGGAAGGFEGELPMPLRSIEGTDIFYKTIEYPSDSRLEYKFIADGIYVSDAFNKKVVNNNYKNNEFYMPDYIQRAEEKYYSDIPHGTIENKVMTCNAYNDSGSLITNAQRNYSVYLPPGYSKDKKYKTIYFQDGKGYLNEANVPNILDYMIEHKEIEPMVAVFINYVGSSRDADYIKATKLQYADFLVNTFIPKMEADYSLISDKEGRILVGASNSGSFVLYAAYRYPDKFKYILSDSGAFNALNDSRYDTVTFKNLMTAKLPIKIFMISGYYEFWHIWNRVMYEVLKNNQSVEAIKYKKYNMTHCFGMWGDSIREGILWLQNPNSKTTIEEKSGQKISLSIGWDRSAGLNVKAGAKCYIRLVQVQGKTIFDSANGSGSETLVGVKEIVPGVTEQLDIPIALTKAELFKLNIFYDNNNDGVYNYGDTQCQNEYNNSKIIIDREDTVVPRMIVGQYK